MIRVVCVVGAEGALRSSSDPIHPSAPSLSGEGRLRGGVKGRLRGRLRHRVRGGLGVRHLEWLPHPVPLNPNPDL